MPILLVKLTNNKGIEISHPLYATIFLSLVVSFLVTITNISVFPFVSNERYLLIANALSGLIGLVQCICWCITSIIRYIYIVHEDWIHSKIPNVKMQTAIALMSVLVSFFALLLPAYGFAIYLGKVEFQDNCKMN
jgi:hypothetical protein